VILQIRAVHLAQLVTRVPAVIAMEMGSRTMAAGGGLRRISGVCWWVVGCEKRWEMSKAKGGTCAKLYLLRRAIEIAIRLV